MKETFITPDAWSIIEDHFDPNKVEAAESIFSIGNGAMGQRANFEEKYSGKSFQGSYIAGVYYPDKTRVGWWKNGYPESFAKVLNAPNWIGINLTLNNQELDLNKGIVHEFRRELNMKEGWYSRSFVIELGDGAQYHIKSTRFLCMFENELGVIKYDITPLTTTTQICCEPYIDGKIVNQDSNWDDAFWQVNGSEVKENSGFLLTKTNKTNFEVCTFMNISFLSNGNTLDLNPKYDVSPGKVCFHYDTEVIKGQTLSVLKFGGYVVSTNHPSNLLINQAEKCINLGRKDGYETLLKKQADYWEKVWRMSDISIEGDLKAQQGIRFNIFQLNQTYTGYDDRLNIGPKGFTGEKYGGSTYWDTEAYCLPFYMATKSQEVARNLLQYRHNQLSKAIENAQKLGFNSGAALYPMVTMNGEECHNEWEITFEEIHRNAAIAYAIYNYERYTADTTYVEEKGLEVLIGISRFWAQRVQFSKNKGKYVILGVTGPNEYENNVNNNWYTNFAASWCLTYTIQCIKRIQSTNFDAWHAIASQTKLEESEMKLWEKIASNMYYPYDETRNVYLQQDGFLDKDLQDVSTLKASERPINQHWSWDRILRSPYIKQADVLQGFYFFESHFDKDSLERHFDFYEPLTVHESSLSPCIHAILASKLERMDQAYEFYLRTARLDLDDYNAEVEEGLHITSMAGTWLSIIEGFAGMRMINGKLSFSPQIPEQWTNYSFKINFRKNILCVQVSAAETRFLWEGTHPLSILVNGSEIIIDPNKILAT